MSSKQNKRKNSGQIVPTGTKRKKTEHEHKPSQAAESSVEHLSPSPQNAGIRLSVQTFQDPGPSQSPNLPSRNVIVNIKEPTGNLDSKTGKIFNDPIHGHIEIHPLCVKIIDTPQFQRLRSIKQLGGTYFVYPGASHTRFEHSIGVCHLAGELASALKARQPDLKITPEDVLCVQIAGLCHDLGHGPFSHMFDGKFLPSFGIETKHESLSVEMFKHLVEKNNLDAEFEKHLKKPNLTKNKTFIMELIEGPSKDEAQNWPYNGRGKDKRYLYEIVANKRNGIDVDKWDYFARDCHMLGIKNSFDHTRCMKFARVVHVNGEKQICFRDKEVENLYEMFHTRNMLHRRAYQHSVGNIIEIMINEAMRKADIYMKTPGKEGKMRSISETVNDMDAYEKLTDSILDRIICSTHKKLEESREILKKIKRRQLYKYVGHTLHRSEVNNRALMQKYVDLLTENCRELHLSENDVAIDVVDLNYGMKEKNPIDHARFYKKGNPDLAIEIKKEQVSDLLPDKFAEQQIRLYCKKDDDKTIEKAKRALENFANKCNSSRVSGSPRDTMISAEQRQAGENQSESRREEGSRCCCS